MLTILICFILYFWIGNIAFFVDILISWASMGGGGGTGGHVPMNFKGGHNIKCPPPPHDFSCMNIHWNEDPGSFLSFFFACQRCWWCAIGTPAVGLDLRSGKKVSEYPPPPPPHGLVRIDAHAYITVVNWKWNSVIQHTAIINCSGNLGILF